MITIYNMLSKLKEKTEKSANRICWSSLKASYKFGLVPTYQIALNNPKKNQTHCSCPCKRKKQRYTQGQEGQVQKKPGCYLAFRPLKLETLKLTETLVSLSAFVPKDISNIWKEKSRLRDRDYLHRGAPDRSRLYHTQVEVQFAKPLLIPNFEYRA